MVDGCFKFDKKNILKCLTKEFDIRFNKLVEKIYFYLDLDKKPNKEVTVLKLFFD